MRPSEFLAMQKAGLDRACARGLPNLPRQIVSDRAAKTVQDVRGRRQCRHSDLLGSLVQDRVRGAGNRRTGSSLDPLEPSRLLRTLNLPRLVPYQMRHTGPATDLAEGSTALEPKWSIVATGSAMRQSIAVHSEQGWCSI